MTDFATCKAAEVGKIFLDRFDEGIRFIIVRGPCSLCAYVGIPLSHPLAGKNYDDVPVDCHGGLTFGGTGNKSFPDGFYWYGWDYAHVGDTPMYDGFRAGDVSWDVEMVDKDSWSALYSFRKLVRLAESIAAKEAQNA